MLVDESVQLSPWYLNTRRLALLTKRDIGAAAQTSLANNSLDRASGMHFAANLADAMLKSGQIPNLTQELIGKGARSSRLIASLWGVFTFRGVSKALLAERDGRKVTPASFSGLIPIGTKEFEMSGTLLNDHIYSQSAPTYLKGKRRALIVGQFEVKGTKIEVFPYIIGDFVKDLGDIGPLPFGWPKNARIYPSQLNAFEKIAQTKPSTKNQLKQLLDVPEVDVKDHFAAIIGEPFVPKDWGGEKSDLYTSRLTLDERPISAAFIFKGPAVSGALHPANLGKRGDQLVRAFDEPADLIVIQHHNQIANTVIRQAEALAADPAKPRLYCIIDGAETYRILKAYRKL